MKDQKDSTKKQKRRSEGRDGVVAKKQKTGPVALNGSENVEQLGALVLQSEKNYNNIVKLLENVQSQTELANASVSSLQSVFVTLMKRKRLSRSKSDTDSQKQVVEWLRDRYREFQDELLRYVREGSPELRSVGLDCLLECVVAEGRYLRPAKDEYWFPEPLFRSIVEAILNSATMEESFISDFAGNFVDRFGDLTYFTYTTLSNLAEIHSVGNLGENWKTNYLQLLQSLNGFPVSDELESPPESILGDFSASAKTPAPLRPHSLKRAYQDCWLATIRHIVQGDQLKALLGERSHQLISKFASPELLMDFYTGCYNQGGTMALVALEGLFELIEKRNLDYPEFFVKFYSLFDRDLMHIKYRSHFFRLADIFLGSTHLPVQLIASFIKRMARLSLSAPPAAIVAVIPFVYNLLKKHTSCLFMLHRTGYDRDALRKTGMEDPFDENEADPLKTGAIDSSLWELVMLQDHYNPNVGRFCKVLSEQFTKPSFSLEDFLDHSYTTMMEEDWKKEIRKPVANEYELTYLLSGPVKAVEGESKNRFLAFAV